MRATQFRMKKIESITPINLSSILINAVLLQQAYNCQL